MEINNTKLKHTSLTLMSNSHGTKIIYEHFLTKISQEHKLKIQQTP
jgi:hypothetical protein